MNEVGTALDGFSKRPALFVYNFQRALLVVIVDHEDSKLCYVSLYKTKVKSTSYYTARWSNLNIYIQLNQNTKKIKKNICFFS